MATLTTRNDESQSLMDMAMQCYANPEGIWKLAVDNNLPSLTAPLAPGTVLVFTETRSARQREFIRRGLKVATAQSTPADPPVGGAFNNDFGNDFDNNEL